MFNGNPAVNDVWIGLNILLREDNMFEIGDKIVYPLHGAGEIEKIEKRKTVVI